MTLILPGDPGFYQTLSTPPPDPTRCKNFVVRVGSLVPEAVDDKELDEYLEGGEYDDRLKEIGAGETDSEPKSDVLYLPCSISF